MRAILGGQFGRSAHIEGHNGTEVDSCIPLGIPTELGAKMSALERQKRKLRQAKQILRWASAQSALVKFDGRSE